MTNREKEVFLKIKYYVENEYDDIYLDFDDYVAIYDILERYKKMELILTNKIKWGIIRWSLQEKI